MRHRMAELVVGALKFSWCWWSAFQGILNIRDEPIAQERCSAIGSKMLEYHSQGEGGSTGLDKSHCIEKAACIDLSFRELCSSPLHAMIGSGVGKWGVPLGRDLCLISRSFQGNDDSQKIIWITGKRRRFLDCGTKKYGLKPKQFSWRNYGNKNTPDGLKRANICQSRKW